MVESAMSMAPLTGIRACVFDAYGTVFDYASAAARCSDVPDVLRERLNALWREKQLQYTWLRTLQQRHVDFWQVTGEALDFALQTLGITDDALHKRLMSLYLTLNPFPEVPQVFKRLKAAGLKIAILSNGSPGMLTAAVQHAELGPLLDAVLSIESVGCYKPHPKVYQLAVDRMGFGPGSIVYQSSNAWDAWTASAYGLRVVWCNRYAQCAERLPGRPDREIPSLAALPALVGA